MRARLTRELIWEVVRVRRARARHCCMGAREVVSCAIRFDPGFWVLRDIQYTVRVFEVRCRW